MYYTIAPLVPISMFAILFLVALVSSLITLISWVVYAYNWPKHTPKLCAYTFIGLFTVGSIISAGNRNTEFLNEPVTATKVRYGSDKTTGKYPTTFLFVTYLTPDGEVNFKTGEGLVYPDVVTLYKQKK